MERGHALMAYAHRFVLLAIANAIARWVIGRPAFPASGMSCSTTSSLRWS
jgi:hypothetical protein